MNQAKAQKPKVTKRRNNPEYHIQCAAIEELQYRFPHIAYHVAHYPAGAKIHDAKTRFHLKKMGVQNGFLDLFMLLETEIYSGIFIDVKAGVNTYTSSQKERLPHLKFNNFYVCKRNTVNSIIDTFVWYYGMHEKWMAYKEQIRQNLPEGYELRLCKTYTQVPILTGESYAAKEGNQ